MRPIKLLAGSAAIAALVTVPVSSASSACWHPRHDGCFILALPFCVAGAVVGTAAVVAATPFVIAGDVLDPRPRPYYYGCAPRPAYYYGRPWAYYAAPRPAYYREPAYYGPPPGYGGPPPGYYGPPPRYYGPPPGY